MLPAISDVIRYYFSINSIFMLPCHRIGDAINGEYECKLKYVEELPVGVYIDCQAVFRVVCVNTNISTILNTCNGL